MSKRKKSYDRIDYTNGYYNNGYYNSRMMDCNAQIPNYSFTPYNNNFLTNNIQDTYNKLNFNNMIDVLNNIDMNNLNNIVSLLSNGVDINNNLNYENLYNNFGEFQNRNEVLINFLNSLKPMLGIEFSEIIDKFIDFYMEEINKEK